MRTAEISALGPSETTSSSVSCHVFWLNRSFSLLAPSLSRRALRVVASGAVPVTACLAVAGSAAGILFQHIDESAPAIDLSNLYSVVLAEPVAHRFHAEQVKRGAIFVDMADASLFMWCLSPEETDAGLVCIHACEGAAYRFGFAPADLLSSGGMMHIMGGVTLVKKPS